MRGLLPDRQLYPRRRWLTLCSASIVSIWGGLFVAVALLDDRDGSAGHALSIALGTEDPFASSGADVLSVPLAIVSWLLVPTLVGAAVALLVDEHLRTAAHPDPQGDLDGIAQEGGLIEFPPGGEADEGSDDPREAL